MPITNTVFPFVYKSLATYQVMRTGIANFKELTMCELGDQLIDVKGIEFKVAKDYFNSIGIKHTSIDINGENGDLSLNLATPIKEKNFKFDVVTNLGTSEHVLDQYECFRNIHSLCKKNGLFIHMVPEIGSWKGHCEFRYSVDFFKGLAGACGYVVMLFDVIKISKELTNDVCFAMIKTKDNKFISKEKFEKLDMIGMKKWDE